LDQVTQRGALGRLLGLGRDGLAVGADDLRLLLSHAVSLSTSPCRASGSGREQDLAGVARIGEHLMRQAYVLERKGRVDDRSNRPVGDQWPYLGNGCRDDGGLLRRRARTQ